MGVVIQQEEIMRAGRNAFYRFGRLLIALILFAAIDPILAATALAADAVVSGACGESEFDSALSNVQTSGGGTITFTCGNSPFYLLFSSQKTISSAVTIDGSGLAILSGQNSTRLFYVNGGASLTLLNITVRNGNGSGGDGGAIDNRGSLTVDNSKFLYNTTVPTYSGGAIVSYGPLTIQNNSEFGYNEGGGGGAVYPRWGAAVTNISDSSFHHNQAKSSSAGWGGALLAWDGPKVTVQNSSFDQNWASKGGGGLYILANSSLAMKDSSLTTNQSNGNGGALYIQGSANITDTLIANNFAVDYGGGLHNDGTTTFVHSTISNNTGFYAGGGLSNSGTGNLTLIRSSIANNYGYTDGGGVSASGVVTILNSQLIGNRNQYYGGAITASGVVNVNFSTIIDLENASSPSWAVYNYSGYTLNIKNSIIRAETNDCGGPITSQGFNIASDGTCSLSQPSDKTYTNAQLGMWQDANGAVWYTLPLPGSPAVDSGQCSGVTTDLRGASRPVGAACDRGALERNGTDPSAYVYMPLLKR